ncbi:MAG: MFS transporter [Micromonosporaceae bacterium]
MSKVPRRHLAAPTRTAGVTGRAFGVLVAGYSASTFGNFLNLIALNLYTYQLTGSATLTGLMMALKLGAGFLAGPVAGVLATRCDRRYVMIASDLTQAAGMLALVVAPSGTHTGLLYAVAAVLGAGNTVFLVSLRSSVPEMVGPETTVRANSHLVTGKAIGMVAGYASAGLIVASWGYDAAFSLNAASFVVSALVLMWLPVSFRRAAEPDRDDTAPAARAEPPTVTEPPAPPARTPFTAARALYAVAPVALAMVALRGLDAFGSASHNVAFPVFADLAHPENPALFLSQFWLGWAVGSLTASQLVPRWLRRTGTPHEWAFPIAMTVMSVAFVATFLPMPLGLLIGVALVAGAADGATEIVYTSRLQGTDDDLRGPVFGLASSTETFGFAAGMVASALLLDQLPVPAVVGLFHGVVIVGVAGFLILLRARRRQRRPQTPVSGPATPDRATPGPAAPDRATADRAAPDPASR